MKTSNNYFVEGNIVDIHEKKIFPGRVTISDGKITSISTQSNVPEQYILPGFVDAHVHVESSMLTPGSFAEMAVKSGTVAVVADPHEIANILGLKGVDFMIKDGKDVPLKFYFGAPSCVPATPFESSGATIGSAEIEQLLENDEIHFLSEMMNFPGVVGRDKEVMEKIDLAKRMNKKIDGHAPGLSGSELKKYIEAGITTDHECATIVEAKEKLAQGMKILIREGSAAKDFDNLFELIDQYPDDIMLCTDDIHPDDLEKGHINLLVREGVKKGANLFNILRAVTLNPQNHYGMKVGLLQKGDPADLIIVKNLESFDIQQTIIDGKIVYNNKKVLFSKKNKKPINIFIKNNLQSEDLIIQEKKGKIKIIIAKDGELITQKKEIIPKVENNKVITDPKNDILKIVVLNRYKKSKPSLGFIEGFGLKSGAIASSIAHDSHNVIGIGVTDKELARAVNIINDNKGGIAVVKGDKAEWLKLPVGGIMTNENGSRVAEKYKKLNGVVYEMGSELQAPFMTMSFMALLVIPKLKISDISLFDVEEFKPVNLFETDE